MSKDNIKFVGNGVTVYIATSSVKDNWTNGIKVITTPSTDTTPQTSSLINLNKVEQRFTINGTLVNGKLNASETHTGAIAKKFSLKTMFGLGSIITMTWEGVEYGIGVDKCEIGYVAKDEAILNEGTTTATSASKLIQSGQNFLSTVSVGSIVHNITTTKFTTVTAIDSDTTLSLTDDIIASGALYTIYQGVDGVVIYDVQITCIVGSDLV